MQIHFPLPPALSNLSKARLCNLVWSAGFNQARLLAALLGQHDQLPAMGRAPTCDLWTHQFGDYPTAHRAPDGLHHLSGHSLATCPQQCRESADRTPNVPPERVPHSLRCPLGGEHWPGYQDREAREPGARIRHRIAQTLGSMCCLCGGRPALFLDHDHYTGLIRGYLCRHCNSRVDLCPHPNDCPFADYLNAPPAIAMNITHPRHTLTMRKPMYRQRCARLTTVGLQPDWYNECAD